MATEMSSSAHPGLGIVLGGLGAAFVAAALGGMARWGLVEPTGIEGLCLALSTATSPAEAWLGLRCGLRPWVIESFQHHGWSRISALWLLVAVVCHAVHRVRPTQAGRWIGPLASWTAISAAAFGLMLYDTDLCAVLLVAGWATTWQTRTAAYG